MRTKTKPRRDRVLRMMRELKAMSIALERMDAAIRKKPDLFKCANDYVVLNHFKDRVQGAVIGVGNAISWAHGEKYGRPKPLPIPEPPEFDNCPHCKGQIPYTFPGINCPLCGKRLREPNLFVELMRKNQPKAMKEVLADIDATE